MGTKRIKGVYFWDKPNFGDQINRMVMNEMIQEETEFSQFDTCDLFAVGSLLERFLTNGIISEADRNRQKKCLQDRPCHIWGSGLLYDVDPKENNLVRPLVFHALRGEKTKHLLEEITNQKIHCVLADPGLLAPLFEPAKEKKYHVGIIPHYRDANLPVFEELKNHYPNAVIIDVAQSPKEVFSLISSCEYIISTSLHGIICADAYGVKNCWCITSDQVFGDGFKFHDYFSSFHTDRVPLDLRSGVFPEIEKDFRLSYEDPYEVTLKQYELINAMPFEIYPSFAKSEAELPEKVREGIAEDTVTASVRMIKEASLSYQPEISVIVPVYNTVEFLGECIESILNNTFKSFEIIIVDDGSYDGSLEKAKQYADQYDCITLLTQRNSTQAFARNLGMALAKGRYIYFADSDDIITSDALGVMYEKAEKDQLDLLVFNASVIAEEDVEEKQAQRYEGYYHRDHPYEGIYTGRQLFTLLNENDEYRCVPYLMFLRKDFLDQNNLKYSMRYYHEDELFAFLVYLHAKKAEFIDDTLYLRRLRSGSVMMSNMTRRNVLGYFYAWMKMLDQLNQTEIDEPEKSVFVRKAYEMLATGKRRYRQMKDDPEFFKELSAMDSYIFEAVLGEDEISYRKLNEKYSALKKEHEKLKKKYKDITESLSFRSGRAFTWLPRKLRDLTRK